MVDPIERAVAASLPERTVETIDHQTTRPGNETARVPFADGSTVYVKTTTDGSGRIARETAAMRYAAVNCDVGVPSIVAADPSADDPFLVTEPLPGTIFNDPWTGDGEWETLCERLGEVVAGVHVVSQFDTWFVDNSRA